MENGWVCVHRKILENPMMNKSGYLALWIVLLLKANHKEKKMIWNGKTITIQKGQFITSRDVLSKHTGIHRSSIERILKYLENEQQIKQETTTKFRLITILNWEKYQDENNKVSNKRATNEQQASTNNNDNNDNKLLLRNSRGFQPPPQSSDKTPNTTSKKKTQTAKFIKPTVAEVQKYCETRKNGINAQAFIDKYEAIGWVVGKARTPMKDWRATIRTWENYRKENKFGQVLQSDQSHKIVDKMNSKMIKA